MGYLVNLPNLRQWQDLRTSHVKLGIFIHGNITGLTIAMKNQRYHCCIDAANPDAPRMW